jgi:cytochrome c2
MLVSIVWMFADDYYRGYKVEIRNFRDVEAEMFNRAALAALPDADAIKQAEADVENARKQVDQKKVEEIRAAMAKLLPSMVDADAKYQDVKANYDSRVSIYNIAVDHHGVDSDEAKAELKRYNDLGKELNERLVTSQNIKTNYDALQQQLDEIEKPVNVALARLKKLNDDFDRAAKSAAQKRWGWGDKFRALPVIDAFASPTKIQQYTLPDLPIDYSFKQVTRYDRCTTCHQGLERTAYTKENLRALTTVPEGMDANLKKAREMVAARQKLLKGTPEAVGYDPDDLRINKVDLSEKEINEFCAHPRLDLFVDANSPHPAEKFGCTSCHGGQGSATSFDLASHTPNNAVQKQRWQKEHGWEANHFWDFPMQPKRFVESTCIKCHHQVTDLIREGNKFEAPKLLRGYNLIRENGCFGCHEIAGIKGGRWVGPDLRLEPYPPLEDLSPAERVKALSDPLNPPGTMRKVGPSLRRIIEKTNPEWVKKWIHAPRGFRPDTKMPHFYGLSNNNDQALKGTDQEAFPDAEIASITYYLFQRSKAYLDDVAKHEKDSAAQRQKVQEEYQTLFTSPLPTDQQKKDEVKARMEELSRLMLLWNAAPPIAGSEVPPLPKEEQERQQQLTRGRQLFSERGCLACHMHNGTTKPQGNPGQPGYLPAIDSDAHHGPNLSRLFAKLGTKPGDETSARRWLVHWIMNPTFYHPRTFMPITHLNKDQANDVAAWLLSQKVDWEGTSVPEPRLEALQALARVHLDKILTRREVNDLFDAGNPEARERTRTRLEELKKRGADEGELAGGVDDSSLKLYLGRKAIGQLGCFGCHDIPGFEQSKPIGTPLNDWGKKDPERLAFEDVKTYVKKHHDILATLTDKDGQPLRNKAGELVGFKNGKTPYEQFFYESLIHDHREGFLHQKLMEPRSFDYDRIRRWDERLRMPQFRFSRQSLVQIPENASEEEKTRLLEQNARAELAEAEAREAVMTFVLGLVAEPVPARYVNEPTGDRKHEVVGRKVIDKFNCNGCHLIRPGVYDFKPTERVTEMLTTAFNTTKRVTFKEDFNFLHSNAWVGAQPPRSDRLTAFGVRPRVEADRDDPTVQTLGFFLSEALRFNGKVDDMTPPQVLDLRASSFVTLPLTEQLLGSPEVYQKIVNALKQQEAAQTPEERAAAEQSMKEVRAELDKKALGGTFSDLLTYYLMKRDPDKYKSDEVDSRAAGPPSLLREGEKTQPAWLFQFLRNPGEIRPQIVRDNTGRDLGGVLVLRMPKFNMSDDEAMALVNYFAAVDRVSNPASGLDYPYLAVPQRQEEYLHRMTREYVERLKKDKEAYDARIKALEPIWQGMWDDQGKKGLESRRRDAQSNLDEAKKSLDAAKTDTAKARAQADVDRLQKQVDALKDDDRQKADFLKAQVEQWETQDAYLQDAFRLAASSSKKEKLCLNCHRVGDLGPPNPLGPNLNLSWERLRPDWAKHWIANPTRMSAYPAPMPQNMPSSEKRYQELFVGTPLDQVIGVRDALMNYPKLADMPVIRRRSALEVVGGP